MQSPRCNCFGRHNLSQCIYISFIFVHLKFFLSVLFLRSFIPLSDNILNGALAV